MSKKKTHETYVVEVNTINKKIEVVGQYNGVHVKILHRCIIDGYEWYAEPNAILHGHGCPKCKWNAQTKSHEQYVQELRQIMPHIKVVEDYVNDKTKILHKCLIDGNEWMVSPHQLLSGHGCPECDKNNRTKLHNEYVRELFILNPNLIVLDTYVNNKTKLWYQCKIDGYKFYSRADSVLFGTGCPKCEMSHGEKDIDAYLRNHNYRFESQYLFNDCKNIYRLPFDFYLPDYNVCIEYDGEQHFKPVEYFGGEIGFQMRQKNDAIKNDFCIHHNIILLRIRYDQEITRVLDDFFNQLTAQN